MTLLLEYLYKGHWDKRHGSVGVLTFKSAFFLERQWEQLELQAKWGKHWTSLSPIIVQQLEDLFPQIILGNEMILLYQLS